MNKKITVLYKSVGKAPTIKIIADMLEIKKIIVQGDLDMVKYENYIIVCNNQKNAENDVPNIVLDFKHISGDFFLIGYDDKMKDFRSLTNNEVNFYKDILNSKSFRYDQYLKWQKKCNLKTDPQQENFEKFQNFHRKLAEKSNREIAENDEEKLVFSPSTEQMVSMILNIQAVIFKFLRNMNGNIN